MNQLELIEKKDLRDQYIDRLGVLDKVKSLFLIPKLDVMTTKQVAEYYEVDISVIQRQYQRNMDEIDSDGTILLKPDGLSEQDVHLVKERNGCTAYHNSGIEFTIPYRGAKAFSKRAILRIGMLLRDSKIAQEVRTQLLNTFEHATEVQRTYEIDEEKSILGNIVERMVGGDNSGAVQSLTEYVQYKNRHITELQTNNKMLAAQILEWTDRKKLNKAIRLIAATIHQPFGFVWKDLYEELFYKHGMGLAMRGEKPLIQHVREDEWVNVQQSLTALCDKYGVNVSRILQSAKMDITSKDNLKEELA